MWKYVVTSVGVGCAPPIWKQAKVQGLKGLDPQSEGTRIGILSPLGRFRQARHIVPTALLVRVQRFSKNLYKAVEGQAHV